MPRRTWSVRYKYSVEDTGNGWRVDSVQTTTIITITMPVWSPLTGTPKALKDRGPSISPISCDTKGGTLTTLAGRGRGCGNGVGHSGKAPRDGS